MVIVYSCDIAGQCTQQTYDKETDDKYAIIELNYMRWLVGFEVPTVITNDFDDQVIQCAMNCASNGRLEHFPASDSRCYTGAALDGCSTSNLAASTGQLNAATALQNLINDFGDGNLEVGHRRWILSRTLKRTAFGGAYDSQHLNNFGYAVAQKTNFGDSEIEQIPFTAYPPPGYFPAQFVYNRFSFWSPDFPSNSPINISAKINNEVQNVTLRRFEITGYGDHDQGVMFSLGGYGRSSYDSPYHQIVNKRIDIQIKCADKVYDYTIYPIDCSDKPMRTPVPTIEGDDYDKLDIGEAPKQKRQKKVAIGAGVGVSLVVIVIIILVLFIVFRHGCSHNHDNDETNNNNNNNDNNDDHSDSGENHLEDA
ncbi:hypothetical protein TVAG_294800 [Trichomonas vaginalis G3]|uniref:SCP domain-containing protein n=1 Tax=Trichomonas vaginalis (strain ATCC PRA-98 / G3) TaxID=412133 RepID=A2DL38_TRIV3|nr:DNA-directed 5'-3' RNA polymerase protein [Trichomonas vaginalis G3]EAY18829.1 hypothetical protein TVAG_294800 [Trichomonas vaginalis G3]KAI5526065.1 DNA-directed 5'-3' RNA polymerase protein [Trichomonas vaginalis G3]|eukprot:XP_001579815.1 hypothetical protein [Trichomonas vaginalis G3]